MPSRPALALPGSAEPSAVAPAGAPAPAGVPTAPGESPEPLTLLVGNANVGKSVLFGVLTGRYATVSNYPGTTVELTAGRHRGGAGRVLDLPGANTLVPNSEDEQVTRDVLLAHLWQPGSRAVQVCDAKNLRQGVALALQLAELEVPLVFVANMLDEAATRGLALDAPALAGVLGVEVLGAVATRRQGLASLLADRVAFRPAQARAAYPAALEAGIDRAAGLLPPGLTGRRGLALLLLADPTCAAALPAEVPPPPAAALEAIRAETARELPEPIALTVQRARQAAAERIMRATLRRAARPARSWLQPVGTLALHPVTGLPFAALVLYGVYLFVGVLGAGTAVDFLEATVFEGWVTPWADRALRAVLPAVLEGFLVGPPGTVPGEGAGLLVGSYGLLSMGVSYAFAIVLPIVGFFFITFSILEDSGYLPRLAVVLNRLFRVIGLNGKAVMPMILGLGCDTMATITARILPTRKERVIVTLLLALGVPCSAQLGVILGMLGGLSGFALGWWLGTVAGVMLLVGFLAARILPGRGSDFVLEIPPMRLPALGNIAVKTLARVEWYLREVVPLFLLGTFILWTLDRIHALAAIERFFAPVVQGFLGLPARATDAFLIGFLRRDYGAAGLYDLFREHLGAAPPRAVEIQITVALVTITLFIPCVANLLMIVKERGPRTALWMTAFIFPFAFAVGGALNALLRWWYL